MPVMAGYLMPHPPVLIPEVGNGRERICDKTLMALKAVSEMIQDQEPELLVLITPHGPMFSDGMAIGGEPQLQGNLRAFGAPEVAISQPNALDWVYKIIYEAGKIDIPLVKIDAKTARTYGVKADLDHGALVPLYFINRGWQKYRLIHITYGLLSIPKLYAFGKQLQELFEQSPQKTVVVASGDLSHCLKDDGPYAFHPDGPRFDEAALHALESGDFVQLLTLDATLVKNAGECAFRSLSILGGVLDGRALESRCHSYEGPFGVGYGVCSFVCNGKADSSVNRLQEAYRQAHVERLRREDPWVSLARQTVESFVRTRILPTLPDTLPEAMLSQQHGVFVSIKSPSGLRGCIGTFGPSTPSVAQEILENAVKAATEDPRFPPIEAEELEDLTITVDVLMPCEPIQSPEELDPKRYGVIVQKGMKRGLLLPDLEGVDTVHEQIRIALQKAGIMESENYTLQRFEVVRHH